MMYGRWVQFAGRLSSLSVAMLLGSLFGCDNAEVLVEERATEALPSIAAPQMALADSVEPVVVVDHFRPRLDIAIKANGAQRFSGHGAGEQPGRATLARHGRGAFLTFAALSPLPAGRPVAPREPLADSHDERRSTVGTLQRRDFRPAWLLPHCREGPHNTE